MVIPEFILLWKTPQTKFFAALKSILEIRVLRNLLGFAAALPRSSSQNPLRGRWKRPWQSRNERLLRRFTPRNDISVQCKPSLIGRDAPCFALLCRPRSATTLFYFGDHYIFTVFFDNSIPFSRALTFKATTCSFPGKTFSRDCLTDSGFTTPVAPR